MRLRYSELVKVVIFNLAHLRKDFLMLNFVILYLQPKLYNIERK